MNRKKMHDVFNVSKGIFYYLNQLDVPWKPDTEAGTGIDSVLLDSEYMFNIAGDRFVSPLLAYYVGEDETITDIKAEQLALIIFSINSVRWSRLWETLNLEYNPIENYDMHEVMTDDETVIDYGKTVTRTPNTTETSTNEVQGFNSSTYNPSDKVTTSETGTESHAETGSDTHTRNYDLRRTGNIGVTTSQQMIESERALWVWNFFHDVVFPDLNKYLTLSIY